VIDIKLERPQSVILNRDKTATLYYSDKENVKAYMYGGVCWPILVGPSTSRSVRGFVVLLAYDVLNDVHSVVDQQEFVTVDHFRDENNMITHYGVGMFFNRAWKDYFAERFYYNQRADTHRRYKLEILRSYTVSPKPLLLNTHWDDDEIADQSVIEKAQLRKLKWSKESLLDTAVEELIVDPDHSSPEWNALRCAVVGFDRYPWRKPKGD